MRTWKRFKPSRAQLLSGALILSAAMLAYAVPNVFTAGTTVSAAQMNANFADVEARIAALEARLASVSNVTVNGQPTVRFSGVNVQVVNGMNATNTANGTGNLIVGYDEADTSGATRCTIGTNPTTGTIVVDGPTCTAAGGDFTGVGFKTGSHYVVLGSENNYSRWGGLLAGFQNTGNYDYAVVSGGSNNIASGLYAGVSGGYDNWASGPQASVSGGGRNRAPGAQASVSGGYGLIASGSYASAHGGINNTASGAYASITGGFANTASGTYASVSGGNGNTASGPQSSVSGGNLNVASGTVASVSGGASNTASGVSASVSGGNGNTASGGSNSVSGGSGCNFGAAVGNKWVVGTPAGGCSATLGN